MECLKIGSDSQAQTVTGQFSTERKKYISSPTEVFNNLTCSLIYSEKKNKGKKHCLFFKFFNLSPLDLTSCWCLLLCAPKKQTFSRITFLLNKSIAAFTSIFLLTTPVKT